MKYMNAIENVSLQFKIKGLTNKMVSRQLLLIDKQQDNEIYVIYMLKNELLYNKWSHSLLREGLKILMKYVSLIFLSWVSSVRILKKGMILKLLI